VTLRALLSHTAGLPKGASTQFGAPNQVPSISEVLAGQDGVRVELVAEPGTEFRYSNPGYAVVELLIQSVTGVDFAEWARTRVLSPLGMVDSAFAYGTGAGPDVVGPHRRAGHPLPETFFAYRAPGGLLTTAHDMLGLAAAVGPDNRGGGVVPARLVEEMWSSPPPAARLFLRHGGYGLGQVWGRLASGRRFMANQGSRPGWRSLLVVLPEESQGMVVLTNASSGTALTLQLGVAWLRRTEPDSLRPWKVLTIPRRD
jgi:CubicO group peptidase (beta-lactamase class C family)